MGPMGHAGSLPLSHRCLPARLCLPGQWLFPAGEGGSAGGTWALLGACQSWQFGKRDSIPIDGNTTSLEGIIVVGSYYLMIVCLCHFKNSRRFAFFCVICFLIRGNKWQYQQWR